MTHRIGPKGQVVIPKPLRDALGMQPGDAVDFALEEGAVRVRLARPATSLRGRCRGMDLIGDLERERRAERAREDSA